MINFRLSKYLHHWLYRVNEHSLHSPFFYDFYIKIIAKKYRKVIPISEEMKILLKDSIVSGFHGEQPSEERLSIKTIINKIVKTKIASDKLATFYLDLLHYFDVQKVIYISTNINHTAVYLANKENCKVFAFGENTTLSEERFNNFSFFKGKIISSLSHFLETSSKYEMIVMDVEGYGEIMNCFELLLRKMAPKSIFVISDIHRSEEVEKAWMELKENPVVNASVDLFYCGILIFNQDLRKQHYLFALT